MNPKCTQTRSRRGSIYLVVLVTIAVVTTMILLGIKLRKSTNEQYRMGNDYSKARIAARSAVEVALVKLDRTPVQFLEDAKLGVVLAETPIGDATAKLVATDRDTGLGVTDSTTTVRVTATGALNNTRSLIGFDLQSQSAYLDMLVSMGASSYWALDEQTGTETAADSIGNVDGVYLNPLRAGSITFLDGDPAPQIRNKDSTIYISHDSSFAIRSGSIMFWVRMIDVSLARQQGVVAKEGDGAAELFRALYFEGGEMVLSIDAKGKLLDKEYRTDASVFADQSWHHVAHTFGTGGTNIYIDGVRVVYDRFYRTGLYYDFMGFTETSTEPWTLGGRKNTPNPSAPLGGSIARFAFFPTQLGDQEIVDLMDGQLNAKKFSVIEGSFVKVVE
ncbi:MAG: LamG domain-containing protein [Phycisphaerales bacterium]|nr:LamG domain-containing protein [Phycisphaerales bacterium]